MRRTKIIGVGLAILSGSLEVYSDYSYWPKYNKVPTEEIVPQMWNNTDHIIDGWDWSLPPSVTPSEKGIVGMNGSFGEAGAFTTDVERMPNQDDDRGQRSDGMIGELEAVQ